MLSMTAINNIIPTCDKWSLNAPAIDTITVITTIVDSTIVGSRDFITDISAFVVASKVSNNIVKYASDHEPIIGRIEFKDTEYNLSCVMTVVSSITVTISTIIEQPEEFLTTCNEMISWFEDAYYDSEPSIVISLEYNILMIAYKKVVDFAVKYSDEDLQDHLFMDLNGMKFEAVA